MKAKLNETQKAAIRTMYNNGKGMTKGQIAIIFNVSDRTIRKIVEVK